MSRFSILTIVGFLVSSTSFAGDGVLEISSACARDGCFSGDAPGFPVTISASGSYVLTSNLRTISILGQGQNFSLIEITASDVSLDLGGLILSCGTPSVPSFPCATGPVNGGHGILGFGKNISARNGTVRDMADEGIRLGNQARVERVRSVGNAGAGILVGQDGLVRSSLAVGNGGSGIVASAGANVVENVSNDNGGDGFSVSIASTVVRNTAAGNSGDGFDLGVQGGLSNVSGGLASGNTAHSNDGFGLRLETAWGYTQNVLTQNNGGNANPQVSSGSTWGRTSVARTPSCP